ncbi:MAG: peptidase S41 [Chloroflexi bacterium]|nr:peptidase S41 [Chloroflexota bacterium]
MKQNISAVLISLALFFSGCSFLPISSGSTVNLPAVLADAADGPVLITGEFTYTNEFVLESYYVEHAVMLNDMTGFILRDREWVLPVDSQVLGYVDVDEDNNSATYRLSLPAVPEGILNDVNHDNKKDTGVQVFAVAYSPNLTGGVFSEGDDRTWGWPSYLASVRTDTENNDEVTGGKVVIWAPDDAQQFPSGFGEDGLLFTDDDPLMSVPAGYSIVDLDADPFQDDHDPVSDVELYEPSDVALKDYSDLSYTDAFQKLYDVISVEYAFNGIAGKEPDWQALYARVMPLVQQAQQDRDSYAFFLALREFTLGFNDGHVYFDGNDNYWNYLYENVFPGYGFAVNETDAGETIVVYVTQGSEAETAGMQVGSQVLTVNGMDVSQWIAASAPFFPTSSDHLYRYDQVTSAFRAPEGEKMTVKFSNVDGQTNQITLTAFYDPYSFISVDSGWASYFSSVMPVQFDMLNDTIGYIQINSNSDDIGLIIRLFQHALKTFTAYGATDLIIDMRVNGGGTNLGLAGFLYDQDIPIGQLEYYSEKTGQFEPEGTFDKVFPNEEQYSFDHIILLVDQYCASACELEAYGFSQVPGVVVMGQHPTAGMEAEVARGEFVLPGAMTLTIPTGRFIKEDGTVLLEGQGVIPDVTVPITRDSLSSSQDVVLNDAIQYINTH